MSSPSTCSYLGWSKNELFLYLVLSVLTFQSHQDGNLFPGCTLASETIPAVSFIRSVVPAWFGYFFCDKHVHVQFIFSFFGYYWGWYVRVGLPQIVQGGRRISKEPIDNLLTSNSPRATEVTCERMSSYVKAVAESQVKRLNFPCAIGAISLGYPGMKAITLDQNKCISSNLI